MSAANEFKQFILRGNVVDLAVGVVIGAAFGTVVTALVKDIITPLVSIPGKVDFENLSVTVGGGVIKYGDFINVLVSFILIAFAVFFFVVKPVNYLMSLRKPVTADPTTRECPYCVSTIPLAATRCPQCTSDLAAGPPLTQ